MFVDKCGIYQILCKANEKSYVGSSVRIYRRWSQHRTQLRKNRHTNPYLQHAWNAHGEKDFEFSIVEECDREERCAREQHYIDQLSPAFNAILVVSPVKEISPMVKAKMIASLQARAKLVTHCPKGHPYNEVNTYIDKKGKRRCRRCNADRMGQIYENETPVERAQRRAYSKMSYETHREARNIRQRLYMSSRKVEKAEYDRQRRIRMNVIKQVDSHSLSLV